MTYQPHDRARTAYTILASISLCHLLNDMMQSLLPAIYPILKSSFHLDFAQIGLIALANQLTASLLQPVVGLYTDRRPRPYSLVAGMSFTLVGLLLLAATDRFGLLLLAAALVGVGSSVFHPESSRIARLASGGQHGFAQSFFQTGGNLGSSIGPLLAAFIVLPRGQSSIAWFSLAALLAIAVLWHVGGWYKGQTVAVVRESATPHHSLTRRQVWMALAVLLALVFSKYVYLSSLSSYYTFFLIHRFDLSVRSAQLHLFAFLGAVAIGTFAGGPLGDRVGRKYVIWGSILGVVPFSLALPYANVFWTAVLSVLIGLILASAFSAILVYAQELVPGTCGACGRPVFRVRLRHWRHRRGSARKAGRPDQYRPRLSRLLVPAVDWSAGGAAAGYSARRTRGAATARSIAVNRTRVSWDQWPC